MTAGLSGLAGAAPAAASIVGGTTVPGALLAEPPPLPNLYGFVARQDAPLLCTATLVRSDLLLTSNHCVSGQPRESLAWTLGQLNLARDTGYSICAEGCSSRVIDVQRQTNAPRSQRKAYNMALVQFDPPVTSVLPVKLASPEDHTLWEGKRERFTQLGWGSINKRPHCKPAKKSVRSSELRMGTIRLEDAFVSLGSARGLAETIAAKASPAKGDSGGPVLVGNAEDGFTQVGVTQSCRHPTGRADRYLVSRAFTIRNTVEAIPRVYTSVTSPELIGRWVGPMIQTPEITSRYSAVITLTQVSQVGQVAGTIDYPELGCGGTLTYLGATERGGATLHEKLDRGVFRCLDEGTITIARAHIGSVSFVWNHADHRTVMVYGEPTRG